MTTSCISRRKFVGEVAGAAGLWMARPSASLARPLPTGRVAIGLCPTYCPEVTDALAKDVRPDWRPGGAASRQDGSHQI